MKLIVSISLVILCLSITGCTYPRAAREAALQCATILPDGTIDCPVGVYTHFEVMQIVTQIELAKAERCTSMSVSLTPGEQEIVERFRLSRDIDERDALRIALEESFRSRLGAQAAAVARANEVLGQDDFVGTRAVIRAAQRRSRAHKSDDYNIHQRRH